MNKILIIREFRAPRNGEKYLCSTYNGETKTCGYDYASTICPIVAEELEVPENARCLAWSFRDCNKDIPNEHGAVILPRKTVKKWLWERDYTATDILQYKCIVKSTVPSALPPDNCVWRKVEGSEIEEPA